MKRTVTVIDLGSNRIAAASCRMDSQGRWDNLVLEDLQSRGIKEGRIINIDKTVEDIFSIMRKIEKFSRSRLKKLFVTTKGIDTQFCVSRGLVPLSKIPRAITYVDVKKCLNIAAMIRVPLDRAVVQTVVKGFYVDGENSIIKNPIGLYGIKLEVESFVVTTSLSKIQNITKCVDQAGFLLDGIYISSIATANSVLDGEEKEKGVLLLDIGDALTEALLFKDDMLKSFSIIGKGVRTLVDVHRGLRRNRLQALLNELSYTRADRKDNFFSIVLTGGGSLLDGIIEEVEKILRVPARIGLAKLADYKLSSQQAIIHTSTLGLIDHIAKECASYTKGNIFYKAFHRFLDLYESYF